MGSLPLKLDELLATRHMALRGVVEDEIEQLGNDLHILHTLLLKLSEEQDPPLTARYWMKDVRELSYDMEDCADQFIDADARAKIRRATRRKITRLKINRLPDRPKWRPWITNKVSEFRTRAQEATQRYWRYKFDDRVSNPGYSRVGRELPTVYAEPGDLVGMEGPMNELDRWLTNGEEQLKVVSIVGVGGVGKTTLAQKMWVKLQGQFDCRAFVRTAQKPDMRGVLRSILSQVCRHQSPDAGEMHHLIHDLREYLLDKRYFIIIDDLWATSVWDVVSRALPEGNCCSRIITTTEIMEVALACCGYCPENIFKMESLSDDDSEKLLLQRILVSGNRSPQHFDDVLPQITRKCGGLPLAIIIVASLLASQPEKLEQLGCVQNSFGSNSRANPTMEGFMGQILNISFNSLPHYLKTCLLYLSTYPEGYIFLKDDLVKQWVAEGFICAKEGEDMEEVAGSYFDQLVSAGLIQIMDINYNYKLLSYSVHHTVLDLITYKSIEENFITIVDYSQTAIPLADKVCRLSLHFGSATYATTPASTRLSQVRSLFFFGLFNCMPSFVVFKLLRVLILHFWGDLGKTSFNLTGICELFRLRYLQVTCNVTVKLPDQIGAMKNLETLEINARVCAVPPDIVRLPSLLHLCLRAGTNLPDGIGCMRSLRTLKYFDLGNNSEDDLWGLGELTNLRDLHLTYSSLPSSEHLKRNLIALATSLGKLGNLKSLTLAAGTAGTVILFHGSSGMSSAPIFLERLELLPPICIFSRLPKWIRQLRKLCILKVAVRELLTKDIESLTGLPSLTVLSLCVQTAPEGRIVFNDGAFSVLKYFKFKCGVLCLAFMAGAMPNLRRLKLGFNTHIGEKYKNMLAGIEHLLNLQDIAARIGAATESDRRAAESAFKDAISKHPRCPRFNVQWVDPVDEEYRPSEKQHWRQEQGSSGEKHGVLEKAEDRNKHADNGTSLPSTVASRRLKSAKVSKHHVLESMLSDETAEPKSLELSLLEDITNNFSDDQEICRSGFGVVYKGKLPNGSIVVVKRLASAIDDKLFLDGVDCLMSVKHRNIVRFLGYCANTQENVTKEGGKSVSVMMRERLLCFEYLCNGNLQMHLTDESCGFDWHMRYQIIKGICQGLHYLHDNCITHLDLKPDNILFDDKMVPKIVDYGYSRLLSEEISRTVLKNIGGSLAYMATPEYLGGGAITLKSDIYSLGVIIMQIVTGQNKKNYSNIASVLESWRSRLESDASQGHTSLETCYQQVRVCIEIGISCMGHDPGNRSVTRDIIRRLDNTEITERSVRSDVANSPLEQARHAQPKPRAEKYTARSSQPPCWFAPSSLSLSPWPPTLSARTSLPSLPSPSPLPPLSPRSPQPKAESMFMRGGSGRSSNANRTSRSTSLREIEEEAAVAEEDDGGGKLKLYVAVGKDLKDGRSNLLWAARNLMGDDIKFVLLHVHQPAKRIMTGLCKVSANQLEEKVLKAYRKIEKEGMTTLLNQYLNYCRVSLKVQAEKLVIEKNNPANGIIELIDQHHITKLVMGTSSISVKRKIPKSKVAAIVHQQAKPYCQIFYVSKETLACSREANQLSAKAEPPRSSSASSLSDQPEFPPRSVSLPPGHHGYLGSPDQQTLPRRSNSVSYPLSGLIAGSVENMSPTRRHSIDMIPTGFSPNSSQQSTGGSSLGLKDLDSMDGSPAPVSIVSSEEHPHSMVVNVIQNEVFEQLHQVRNELERSRKEASEGRQKAERDLFEASMMFRARENSLRKEKKEVEERLTREKASLEKVHLHKCNELQKANEQRAELENKLLQANSVMEELQQLQGELQREKDHAVREAEEMRRINGNSVFGSTGAVALTEFSYTEIKEATNDFDDSIKIGHGGCGSVYRGFLRHTTVAIKIFNREGTTGEKEFNAEVETLCRMRHPNLVTLIGVCREPKALVFEFLPNGSLEDRLQCKNQTEPLSWRMRIRIAADICTGLIFLHSNKPKGIAHGDLKPDNVLLDVSFVCKLGDFGISRPLNLTNTTVTPYHRTNQIKGTMGYMDPGYIASGELTAQSDVYSFGVVLLRLLTGKSPLGLPNEVEAALSNGMLQEIIDASAGEWPPEYTEELASLALRCCRYDRKERPDLAKEAWGVLQAMMNCPDNKYEAPSFFICPMTQEIMRDPHIAADGFTYEGEAIKDWLQRGHKMSPMTYLNFTHHELIPNNALRFVIQEWQMKQQP